MSLKLSGVTLGDITGGPSSLNLYDLADVSIVSPQTGQYLRYNAGISEWQNAYINSDVYDYLDGAMSGTQGVSLTFTPGPNTIAIGLGAITPSSVAASGTVTGSNLTGTNTGDQTITLTGDVTGSGTGSFTTTLATVNGSPQSNTFRKVTVNGKGLVTATSGVTSSDITTSLGYTPVNVAGDTMTGYLILNADPVAALGAVTKQYVDTVAAGLNVHASCVTATTATLASSSGGTITYNNGASGVGATLTTTGSFATIGGASTADTDRILVKNEATAANNGIYVRTSSTVLTRASDFDNSPSGEIAAGDFTFIVGGTLGGTNWVQTTPAPITVGTTAINFTQLSGPGVYVSGTGIDITGNVISNIGVTSLIAGTNIGVSAATGAVTISVTGTVTSATSATNATNSAITDDTTTNATMYPTWVTTTSGNLPIKISSTKLSFNPSTGVLNSVSFNATSTARVKDAIVDIGKEYLDKFRLLKPREYDRKDYKAHEFGFIAEEMALVYPEVVGCDDTGKPSGIDYGKLSTILTAKIQEQQLVIEQLQTQITTIMGLLKGSK